MGCRWLQNSLMFRMEDLGQVLISPLAVAAVHQSSPPIFCSDRSPAFLMGRMNNAISHSALQLGVWSCDQVLTNGVVTGNDVCKFQHMSLRKGLSPSPSLPSYALNVDVVVSHVGSQE